MRPQFMTGVFRRMYRCVNTACGYKWMSYEVKPDVCPGCGHFYFKWTNYTDLKAQGFV